MVVVVVVVVMVAHFAYDIMSVFLGTFGLVYLTWILLDVDESTCFWLAERFW